MPRPHPHPAPRRRRADSGLTGGFTLVELMVAMAVVAILAAVAYPSYSAQMAKGRRADAKQALLELAQKMERFYSERGTYAGATLGSSGIYPNSSRAGHYTLAIGTQTAEGFSISAQPTGVQAGDVCGTLLYDQLGTASLGTDATASLAQCW